jgi:predicted subunit of tRNA(5-methylaminomethyl-2-thiouridylate) methyltransferase
MSQILQDIDGTLEQAKELIFEPSRNKIEYEDGIMYEDFRVLLDEGASFKETFENIMFSTKVIITHREDLLDFLDHLIENGFGEMAMSYLESAIVAFPTDKDLHRLIKKIAKGKKIEA